MGKNNICSKVWSDVRHVPVGFGFIDEGIGVHQFFSIKNSKG